MHRDFGLGTPRHSLPPKLGIHEVAWLLRLFSLTRVAQGRVESVQCPGIWPWVTRWEYVSCLGCVRRPLQLPSLLARTMLDQACV